MVSRSNKQPEWVATGRVSSASAFSEHALRHGVVRVWAAGCCKASCRQCPGDFQQHMTTAVCTSLQHCMGNWEAELLAVEWPGLGDNLEA